MTSVEFAGYLKEIHKKGKFDYENELTKDTIVKCMKSSGDREEDYIQVFTRILARIKTGAGSPDDENKDKKRDKKQVNIMVDGVRNYNMAVFFETKKVKTDGKMTRRYEIYKIKIVQHKNKMIIKTIFP